MPNAPEAPNLEMTGSQRWWVAIQHRLSGVNQAQRGAWADRLRAGFLEPFSQKLQRHDACAPLLLRI